MKLFSIDWCQFIFKIENNSGAVMFLRKIVATLLAMLRLFTKMPVWIALALALVIGIVGGKLRLYAAQAEMQGAGSGFWREVPSLFGFAGCAILALILARELAGAATLRRVNWAGFFGANLVMVFFQYAVQFLFATAMAKVADPTTFSALSPWFTAFVLWALFLPMTWAVVAARGTESAAHLWKTIPLEWHFGFAIVIIALMLGAPLFSISRDRLAETSVITIQMLAALGFVFAGMVPWLFAIAGANVVPDHGPKLGETFT